MKSKTFLCGALLSVAACCGQSAKETKGAMAQSSAPAKKLMVLTAEQTDPSRLLPAPAGNGSEAQQKELAAEKLLVKTRTQQRFEQAKWDNAHESPEAFAAVLGTGFDLAKLPATAKLLAAVMNDQAIVAGTAKEFFHRAAPVVASSVGATTYKDWTCDANAKPPAEKSSRAYPSGHVTMGYALAVILSALMPEKSQAILTRAADYAYSREVCGDHYHSDIEAGHALGNSLGILLLNNTALKPQMEAARTELRAARLTN